MTSILFQSISDSMDDAMQTYTDSDDYRESRNTVNAKISEFRSKLPESEKEAFNQLIDSIDQLNAAFADQAYVTGVVKGIELRQSITTPFQN